MPLIETKGAASAQGFGGAGAGASGPVTYIEDVFSTWLYTGNGSTQTITNGIDLSGKGGLVWIKGRSGATDHALYDTTRGATKDLVSNSTAAETTQSTGLTAFNGTGFSIGALAKLNTNAATYASWTFREQPKFFDVVTYTGNGAGFPTIRTISHNLGSTPGCIIIKRTDSSSDWFVWHRSTSASMLVLNSTSAAGAIYFDDILNVGSTSFAVQVDTGTSGGTNYLNVNGATYVAYLFAHNAGGFGLSGTDNVISCGSYTGNGLTDGPVINLSYEPQWVMIKRTDSTGSWALIDIMRGFPNTGSAGNYDNGLLANTSGAEITTILRVKPTSTGFSPVGGDADTNASGGTYIYIAIRRGPMKVPTSGTSVFSPIAVTGGYGDPVTTGFPIDAQFMTYRPGGGSTLGTWLIDRLRGASTNSTPSGTKLMTSNTNAEATSQGTRFWGNTGFQIANDWDSAPMVYWNFRRSPGFFDVVCFYATAGTAGSPTQTFNHNLGVTPELAISKTRGTANSWFVYSSTLGTTKRLRLQSDGAEQTPPYFTALTSSTFTIDNYNTGTPADNNVAYLFATCAGVSKVGSYTGTGALQTIDCGFTGGARFVLIKRTDSTGGWYVYDSARGISSGNDPYLLLNSTAAEVTGTNYVDTTSVGFQVTAAAPAGLNANGGSFVFLAIA